MFMFFLYHNAFLLLRRPLQAGKHQVVDTNMSLIHIFRWGFRLPREQNIQSQKLTNHLVQLAGSILSIFYYYIGRSQFCKRRCWG